MISVTGGSQEAGGSQGGEDHRRICNYIRHMEREGVQRVKMFMVITSAYVIFWGPLFLVTLLQPGRDASALSYEVTCTNLIPHTRLLSSYRRQKIKSEREFAAYEFASALVEKLLRSWTQDSNSPSVILPHKELERDAARKVAICWCSLIKSAFTGGCIILKQQLP